MCCSARACCRRPAAWSRSSTSPRSRSIRRRSSALVGDGSPMEEGARTTWLLLDDAIAACVRGELADLKTELGLRRLRDHLASRSAASSVGDLAVAGRRRRARLAVCLRVLVELAIQRLAIEAEALRGARLVAGLVLEHALDELALELGERHPARDRGAEEVGGPALAHVRRQIVVGDQLALAQRDAALEHVHQLAHVAGPVIGEQQVLRLGRQAHPARRRLLRAELREHVLGERHDVLGARAQRRQIEVDDVEPVVEVLAEAAVGEHRLEVLVRRGDDAHVDALCSWSRRAAAPRAPAARAGAWPAAAARARRSRRGRSCRRRPRRTGPACRRARR